MNNLDFLSLLKLIYLRSFSIRERASIIHTAIAGSASRAAAELGRVTHATTRTLTTRHKYTYHTHARMNAHTIPQNLKRFIYLSPFFVCAVAIYLFIL